MLHKLNFFSNVNTPTIQTVNDQGQTNLSSYSYSSYLSRLHPLHILRSLAFNTKTLLYGTAYVMQANYAGAYIVGFRDNEGDGASTLQCENDQSKIASLFEKECNVTQLSEGHYYANIPNAEVSSYGQGVFLGTICKLTTNSFSKECMDKLLSTNMLHGFTGGDCAVTILLGFGGLCLTGVISIAGCRIKDCYDDYQYEKKRKKVTESFSNTSHHQNSTDQDDNEEPYLSNVDGPEDEAILLTDTTPKKKKNSSFASDNPVFSKTPSDTTLLIINDSTTSLSQYGSIHPQ